MPLSMTSASNERYIRFEVRGEYNFLSMMGMITEIRSEADDRGRNLILVDLRGIEGGYPNSDRTYSGWEVARVFGANYRVSVIAKASMINYIAKTAANSRGATMNVTSSEDDAIRWLLRNDVAPAAEPVELTGL